MNNGKIEFLGDLSAFCVPPVYPEPKGQFVPEALAAGTPVVVPRTGAFPEWIERTGGGLLFEPDDAQSLAEALARLALAPHLARSLGERGRAAVLKHCTAEKMARSVVAVLARHAPAPAPGREGERP